MQVFEARAFDFLFADYSLPGMNGAEMAKRLKRAKPDLRIIFASGYGCAISDAAELQADVVTKPYNLKALAGLLRAAGNESGR